MALNIWGNVAGIQYALPMEALLGTANQLLGMNLGATALQYKNATFDNVSGQYAVPVASAVNVPSYSFTGHLTSGFGFLGARIFLSYLGVQGIYQNVSGLFSDVAHTFNNIVIENQAVDIVASAVPNFTGLNGNFVNITNNVGATVMTGFIYGGDNAGLEIETRFSITGGSVTLTHNAVSFILLGSSNLTLADGDIIRWRKIDPNNDYWLMVSFTRGTNTSIITTKGGIIVGSQSGANPVTPIELIDGTEGQILLAVPNQIGLNNIALVWTDFAPLSLAPNPFFAINQRRPAVALADDTYGLDCWYVLSQTNPVTPSQQQDQENGLPYNHRLTQPNAAAQRMGIATILESDDSRGLRGRNFTFGFRFRLSNAQAIRAAVLEWTGPADAVTSDVVLDWTNGTFTPGNFFLAANLVVAATDNVAAGNITANTWADFLPGGATNVFMLSGTFSAALQNVILLIWTQTSAAQNVTMDISKVKFGPRNMAGNIHIPSFDETLSICQRRYSKAFGYTVAPAQNTGAGGKNTFVQSVAAAAVQRGNYVTFPKRMRGNAPTVVTYNPDAANAQVRNQTIGVDCANVTVNNVSSRGFHTQFDAAAGSAVGNLNYVHWDADAEL